MEKFTSLKELGVLKKALETKEEVESLVSERNEKICDLEQVIEAYAQEEGILEFEEVVPREIALAILDGGYDGFRDVERYIEGSFSDSDSVSSLWRSRKDVMDYLNHLKGVLDRDRKRFSKEEGLGLFLIGDRFYRIFKSRREDLEREGGREIAELEDRLNNVEFEIKGLERLWGVKVYNYFKERKNKLIKGLFDYCRGKGWFGDVEGYISLKRTEEGLEEFILEKQNYLSYLKEDLFDPIQIRFVLFMSNIIKKLANTEKGPFKVELTQVLRKRAVDVSYDLLETRYEDSAISLLSDNLLRYSFLCEDAEKIAVLEEGLGYAREAKFCDEFDLLGYLIGLFISKGNQRKSNLNFKLLDEAYDLLQEIIGGFHQKAYENRDVQVLMHMVNSRFISLDFFIYELKKSGRGDGDYKNLLEHCKSSGKSFKRLYGGFSRFAYNCKEVPEEFKDQYRKQLQFGGI